jgi:hypothetical protein
MFYTAILLGFVTLREEVRGVWGTEGLSCLAGDVLFEPVQQGL